MTPAEGPRFSRFRDNEVADRYPHLSADYPILLRRRAAFALAEQDRGAHDAELPQPRRHGQRPAADPPFPTPATATRR